MAIHHDLLELQYKANIAKAKRTIGLGIALVLLAGWLAVSPLRLMFTGDRLPAKVVELEATKERSLFGDTPRTFPHVEFTTPDGNVVKIRDRFADAESPWQVGDSLEVLFFTDAPDEAIIDRGVRNFSWSGAALTAALVCMMAGYRRFYSEQKKHRHAVDGLNNE